MALILTVEVALYIFFNLVLYLHGNVGKEYSRMSISGQLFYLPAALACGFTNMYKRKKRGNHAKVRSI